MPPALQLAASRRRKALPPQLPLLHRRLAPAAPKPARNPHDPLTVKLRSPVPWGKGETITELIIAPTPRMFRNFALRTSTDGAIIFEPYPLAVFAVQAAGYTPSLADKLGVADFMEVAHEVMGFLAPPPAIGRTR